MDLRKELDAARAERDEAHARWKLAEGRSMTYESLLTSANDYGKENRLRAESAERERDALREQVKTLREALEYAESFVGCGEASEFSGDPRDMMHEAVNRAIPLLVTLRAALAATGKAHPKLAPLSDKERAFRKDLARARCGLPPTEEKP